MTEANPDIRVLLIEDSPGDARLVQVALGAFEDPAFVLDHRDTVKGGLERLKAGGLDVVLSDLALPDSAEGSHLPELVAAAGGLPVVVLTGSTDPASGVELLKLGAQDFLLKGELEGTHLARALRFAVERKKAGDYLEVIAKLRDLDQTRSDFVSAVTHELRTPLVSLKGYTAMLQKNMDRLSPAEIQKTLAIISSNSSRLERLVNQVLTVAKIEKGRLTLLREGVDLVQLAESAARVMEGQSRRHQFKVERRGQVHQALCDPFQIEQVMLNLLSNAVKYWPTGGEIKIIVQDLDDRVALSVVDKGLGIPQTEQERIFKKFERIEDMSRQGIEGAGLGLYLAKEVITLHGGEIHLESKVGAGTTMTFTIPKDGKNKL